MVTDIKDSDIQSAAMEIDKASGYHRNKRRTTDKQSANMDADRAVTIETDEEVFICYHRTDRKSKSL